jgi:hypothetical protein
MQNYPNPDRAAWLKELATKSWSLELTISGAATFAVSFLPGIIEQSFDWYSENLAPSMAKDSYMIPLLAYSFFKVTAWTLVATFILHLCMRALWVGAVGLHSAFPQGIQYDRLPNTTSWYRQEAERHFGTLEDFILRLDRRCNSLFALAFVLAMGLAGIGLLYLVFFVLQLAFQQYFSEEYTQRFGQVLRNTVIVLATALLLTQALLKRYPQHERLGQMIARFQLSLGRVVLPVFARPLQYLSMTFMSNSSRRQYYLSMGVILIGMIISTVAVLVKKIGETRGATPFNIRNHASTGLAAYQLHRPAYDNLRAEGEALPNVSIGADVADGPFLPVFVKYPHYLDRRVERLCGPAPTAERGKRAQRDSLNLACFQRFYRLTLNDSLLPAPEWLFTEKQGSVGLTAYLPTAACRPGRNLLRVEVPVEGRDSLEVFGEAGFWIAPQK